MPQENDRKGNSQTLAYVLRHARGDRSKYAVAKATGVSHGNLTGMERGTRLASEETLARLCAFYCLDFDAVALVTAHDRLRRKSRLD